MGRYLDRLKSGKYATTVPPKLTEPYIGGFVGTTPAHFQKIEGSSDSFVGTPPPHFQISQLHAPTSRSVDPIRPPSHLSKPCPGRSEDWYRARDAFYTHWFTCKACKPTGRCEEGHQLMSAYRAASEVPHGG